MEPYSSDTPHRQGAEKQLEITAVSSQNNNSKFISKINKRGSPGESHK